jgi:serine/threonine protein kinase
MIDSILGNSYRIVEKVGEGGMGAVYRAVDLMLDRDVAIKAIRPELAREPEIVERFRSEARLLARVSHPAIATIYSFFQDGDDLFLAMEFVRGRSLSRVLESEGALPWDQAVRLLSAAMEGIEVAHRAGIIHRDLKPDNLMIGEASGGSTVKVMDFGIARAAGSGHLTRTGLLVGTLRYMAPEQIQGEEADHRVDIYALGAVLYQTITGRSPFDGKSDYAIIKAQIEEMPPPPSTVVPGIPGWLDRAVLRALAKKPVDRFQSVEEMRRFLATRGGTVTGGEATRVTGTRPEAIAELPTVVTPPRPAPRPSIPSLPTSPSQPPPEAGSYRPIPSGGMGWKLAVGSAAVLAVLTGVGVALWSGEEPKEIVAGPTVPAQSLADAPPPAQPAVVPLPTATPARAPERKPRQEPPPPLPEPSPVVQEPIAPVETPAAPEPEPSPEVSQEIPAAPIEELRRLGGELQTESAQLLETYLAFLEKKEDGGADITDADEELEELIEDFAGTAENFNNQLAGRGFFTRLRNRKDADARPQLQKRFKALADRGVQVDRLMNQVQPGPEVRQAWQGIRTRWQRVGTIISGLK